MDNGLWNNHQRIRQYAGEILETWGGVTLNIDSDVIDGVVVGIGGDDATPPSISLNVPAEDQWYSTDQTLSWIITDDGSGVDYFKWEWNDDTPDIRTDSSSGATTLSAAGQGRHMFYLQAWDNAGNASSVASAGWFGYDTTSPTIPQITISGAGCSNIPNNGWQNSCNTPIFSWISSDSGSGIKDYRYYWGTSASGAPDILTTETTLSPAAISPTDGVGTMYLSVTARDQLNNESGRATFGVRYDGVSPTATLTINDGAATTNQVSVWLDLPSSDVGSGVSQMRFSNNGLYWTDWEAYDSTKQWTLPALDRRIHTVYAQVRDRAGNESAVTSNSITLDLYPVMPHSANYRICDDVMNTGGSIGLTSTNFSLISSIGQPWATGAAPNNSASHTESSGFLAAMTGCRPISHTVTNNYTVTQWVIASGGNLRGSMNYRLGDTTGQAAASGNGVFTSTGYTLSSGFWAQITGTVPATETIQPPPITITPTPTPTPAPTPTPQPGGFGLSINDGALFTNHPDVVVSAWAPYVTEMRLSNDGGYSEEGWRSYQLTSTWVISTYGAYVMPRTVYAWFEDAQSTVYGPYQDDIIYDPVAPQGSVSVLDGARSQSVSSPDSLNAATVVTLSLEASDDNSGVAQMRVGEGDLESLPWQAYSNTLTWILQSDVVYAQFRDRAGNISSVYGSDGREHALDTSPSGVMIWDSTLGATDTPYTFMADVMPVTVTIPLTYVWESTGHVPITHAATMHSSDIVSFTWDSTGTKALTVTVANGFGVVTGTHTIDIGEVHRKVYLPLVLRNQ